MTLAERGVALLRNGGTNPVIVVTGAAPVSLPGIIVAHNPQWQTGMGSSLREGLETLPADREAVVIALVDQPLVTPAVVRRLIAAFVSGARLAVACYQGRQRNPVLLSRESWADAAAAAHGDAGARGFLRAHAGIVTAVECGDVGRPDDVDSPEDLARVAQLIADRDAVADSAADSAAGAAG